jgi:hypothetical protein
MNIELDNSKQILRERLSKLTIAQFKVFYAAFVHYRVHHQCFICKQNLFNLWCELNLLCHELDESFPDQYDDHEALRDFCHFHPYYFIDRLPLDLVAKLFAQYVDDRIDMLTNFVKILYEADMRAAYTYLNDTLKLNESVDDLVSETETHIKFFY